APLRRSSTQLHTQLFPLTHPLTTETYTLSLHDALPISREEIPMSRIDALVQDFLAQKKIAVVGVSDKRETGCNLGYRRFKEAGRSEEHTSELQSLRHLVCRLLLEKKKQRN